MVLDMQRYFCNSIDNNKFILTKDDSHHIKTVMRYKLNDLVEVIYNEKLYICEIIEFDPVVVRIKKELDSYNELDVKVTICQSLVKEQKMDYILQKGTELGAYNFIPLKVKNSIVKYSDKDFDKNNWIKLHKQLVLFGRYHCKAKNPSCSNCKLKNICQIMCKVEKK